MLKQYIMIRNKRNGHMPAFLKFLKRIITGKEEETTLRDFIEEIIDDTDSAEHSIDSNEKELLGNVLNLRDLTAKDVMLTRSDIIALPVSSSFDDVVKKFAKFGVSQILIYQEKLDDVVGLIHIKDLVAWENSKKPWCIQSVINKNSEEGILYIAPSMPTLDLLVKMRERGTKMAVVVDEHGGVDGVVSFADVIAEIIGDITDAREISNRPYLEVKTDGTIIADAKISIEDLEQSYGASLHLVTPEDEIDTLGGVVLDLIGRVPHKGEVIDHEEAGWQFEVLDADPRKIRRLLIRPLISPGDTNGDDNKD